MTASARRHAAQGQAEQAAGAGDRSRPAPNGTAGRLSLRHGASQARWCASRQLGVDT